MAPSKGVGTSSRYHSAAMTITLSGRIRGSWRILLKEITAFGLVGAVNFVIDIGLFNVLLHHGVGVLTA